MKKNATPRRSPAPRLVRTRNVYEFIVRFPWGSSAISGYRRAARHFGFHTMEDPTLEGSDAYRVLVHKDARQLRAAAKMLSDAYSCEEDAPGEAAEMWLICESGIHYFTHDWKHWDPEQDEGALECLGWERRVVELNWPSGCAYRVTLRSGGRRISRQQRHARRCPLHQNHGGQVHSHRESRSSGVRRGTRR